MKMRCIAYMMVCLLILCSAVSCNGKKERGRQDIEHALMMLRDRRNAESRVVTEQGEIRIQLEKNYKAAHSDGMRGKIQKEIQMIDISIDKAQVNIANQDTIIFQLELKLDSLIQSENTSLD